MRLLLSLAIAGITLTGHDPAFAQSSSGNGGYMLKPTLAYKNIPQDPDGIWPPENLLPFGNPPQITCLLTARTVSPMGHLILSVADSTCNTDKDCSFRVVLLSPDKKKRMVAQGLIRLGGTATISQDLTKITAETSKGVQTFSIDLRGKSDPLKAPPDAGS